MNSRNKEIKDYFDNWGGRCYLFSSELVNSCYLDCDKKKDSVVRNLSINTKKLKQMGGQYIFSGVPILNAKELGIKFEKTFDHKRSQWRIHLYKLII